MKSFKNKQTGVILTPKNKWVEEQLEANSSYEVVNDKTTKEDSKKVNKTTKEEPTEPIVK